MRRINRRLERLEGQRSGLRVALDGGHGRGRAWSWTRQLAALEREIEHTEVRLRALLAGEASGPEAGCVMP